MGVQRRPPAAAAGRSFSSCKLQHMKSKDGYHISSTLPVSAWIILASCVALYMASLRNIAAAKAIYKQWAEPYIPKELALVITSTVSMLLLLHCIRGCTSRARPVYIMDLACFRPPDILRAPHSTFMEHFRISGHFTEESLEFQRKILERCGLGQTTSFPMCFRYLPPSFSMAAARDEAAIVLDTCMEELLDITCISPNDIGILVVNCSTFNPTPSLCSEVVNKFKLRSDVKAYNISGMGCSASVIAMDLAKNALQVHKDTYAVVLSTENITQNCYLGNNKTMLVSNCLFRLGGVAVLLSNRGADQKHAKYKLEHVVRTHRGADDAAYHAAYQEEDEEGKMGVFLSQDLMRIAAEALRMNTNVLGALVLPYSEQFYFFANYLLRTVFKAKVKPYVPDFKRVFDHFCIHSGGKAVISAVEKGLRLSPVDVEPTKMTLHAFGNTSGPTTWYQFQYLECKGRMRKGHKIWQIAFGSGFKCNSAVYTVLRDVQALDSRNVWNDGLSADPVAGTESRRGN